MKRFISALAALCLTISLVSTSVFAGLITENLPADYQINQNGFSISQPDSTPTITSSRTIFQDDSADIYWLIDTSGLESISFAMKLLGSDSNFALASLFIADQTLWSQTDIVTSLTSVTIDVSHIDFSVFDSNMLELRFMLEANNFSTPSVYVGRDTSSLQLRNIRLARTEVPEPSSIILFLLAMTLLIRRKFVK